jgi:hypothetical protein
VRHRDKAPPQMQEHATAVLAAPDPLLNEGLNVYAYANPLA